MPQNKSTGSVRERLLNAADELFYREGIHTVGIDRILEHAGVAKASLYSTYGSKDELVRAYLEKRARDLSERTESRVRESHSPRESILAVFDVMVARIKAGGYYGCPFMRACAEAAATPRAALEVVSAFRKWRHELFARLARAAGVRNADSTARQLSILYDGAAVAAAMEDGVAAAEAARKAAERLLGEDAAPKRKKTARNH